MSRDPIGELGGENLYAAMLNNPVNAIDPNGEFSIVAALIAGGLVYSGASWLTGIIASYDIPDCCQGEEVSEWQHCTAHCVQAKYFGAAPALISGLASEVIPKLIGPNPITGWSTWKAFWADMHGIVEGAYHQTILGVLPKWWESCAEACEKKYCKCCQH